MPNSSTSKNDYAALRTEMRDKINALEPCEFVLRDVIANPPALLGVYLYEDVHNGTIPNVEHIGMEKDVHKYKKLAEDDPSSPCSDCPPQSTPQP